MDINQTIIETIAQRLIRHLQGTWIDLYIIDSPIVHGREAWKFLEVPAQEWKFVLASGRTRDWCLAYVKDGIFHLRWSAQTIHHYELADPAFPDNIINAVLSRYSITPK